MFPPFFFPTCQGRKGEKQRENMMVSTTSTPPKKSNTINPLDNESRKIDSPCHKRHVVSFPQPPLTPPATPSLLIKPRPENTTPICPWDHRANTPAPGGTRRPEEPAAGSCSSGRAGCCCSSSGTAARGSSTGRLRGTRGDLDRTQARQGTLVVGGPSVGAEGSSAAGG